MTVNEFSSEFDILYDNITSNQAPGLDAYEKSVFLTKAQDEIIKAYFDPKGNKYQEGFDGSERRQIDFSKIVKVNKISGSSFFSTGIVDPRTEGVKSVNMPIDALMIINEIVTVSRGNKTVYLQVIPISYNDYRRLMSKPYKRPLKWQAWRLQAMDSGNSKADLIAGPNDTISAYEIRYVKRPNPIILETLSGETIDGQNSAQTSELDPILHKEILQRAVELAKAAYAGDLQSEVMLGQISATNMGIVAQR